LLSGSHFDDSNPMLGETFEDQRMKFVAEKVRHNPLEMAYHAEGEKWELYATSSAKTKFWGKQMTLYPVFLEFRSVQVKAWKSFPLE
jgi:hypothetical protein